eukprot:TRINITY_DN21461_c0_g1_i1.p1 TRINITY_DN21461_c0_g1~~TRINITY_DN21461_c0_g1_i1.p1  ORF type:complete len:693 (-),score=119.14 TRINITY_DN21461_c0_g1_i1:72-2150(-)
MRCRHHAVRVAIWLCLSFAVASALEEACRDSSLSRGKRPQTKGPMLLQNTSTLQRSKGKEVSEAGSCCSKCNGKPYCSPHSGNCYWKKRRDYYEICPQASCCSKCSADKPYCSPKSGNCYDAKRKDYYETCGRGGTERGIAVDPNQTNGACITNREFRAFEWTAPSQSIREAIQAPFSGRRRGWQMPFGLSSDDVAAFIKDDLLASNPFGDFGVLLPWPEEGSDQLGDGGWIGYSRRQVCYITAQTLLGATTKGYDSGLARLMAMCPKRGHFREAFVALLAACAADPTLKNGGQGPLLLTAKAGAAPDVDSVRAAAVTANMSAAGLRVCDYDSGAPPLPGVKTVPAEGCTPRSSTAVGKDFMTGGLAGQATQDISAAWFGGYLFDAGACGLGGGQDERLSVYFPEVTVLAYFLSSSHPFPQLRQPVWVLGARNFFTGLDGTARFDQPLKLANVPLDSDLVDVEVDDKTYQMSSSRPFLIFMSENQGFFGNGKVNLPLARRNKLPLQRDVGKGDYAFEKQVRAWYRSIALTSYSESVRPALKKLVKSIGAGPWLAGLWWGDSHLGFLAVWLGQAIAAGTWNGGLEAIDYYVYSSFTENPGNQCFVHAGEVCKTCVRLCSNPDPPKSAYWMPDDAYFNGRPCVNSPDDCGTKGLADVVAAFGSYKAAELWNEVESKLAASGGSVEHTVFDELLR